MSTNGDDREAGADASSQPADIIPASETEDNAQATTTNPPIPDQKSPSPQIIPQSPAAQYPPASNYPGNSNSNNNHQSSTFMRQPNGYYAYQSNTPNSPAPTTLGYDSQALLLQHLGTNPLTGRQQPYGLAPPPPLSPGIHNNAHNNAQNDNNNNNNANTEDKQISLGVLAPSSPVFPGPSITVMGAAGSEHQQHVDSFRMAAGGSLIAPPSPSIHFPPGHPQSPVVSGYPGVGVYSGYVAGSPGVGYGSQSLRDMGGSADSRLTGWPDRVQQQPIYQTAPPSANSPHVQPQPMPMSFQTADRRTASFDEMLPGPAIDDNGSLTGAGTIFSQQQAQWAYNLNSPYTASPQQPQIHPSQPGGHRALQAGQQLGRSLQGALGTAAGYYPATTPGPPIQTTHHNKGPDGANLFIFHIPNHFTNLDMWHLFCHYGNLLSVRIMVEKDSGRSRGFGFVSYDSPDAAAMAIKELNGFVIGNKRLKVQHKQIRPSANNNNNNHASQQDNFQSPPLFPPHLSSNGHNAQTTGDADDEHADGNIQHYIGHSWLDNDAAAHGGTPDAVEQYGGQHQRQQHRPGLAGELDVVSEMDPQNNGGQSNSNHRYDDGSERNVGSPLGNMEQLQNAVPDVTK